ncbi:trypsin-like peptidase domain-containing protein [Streptomyces sp. NPDC048518]|uniref:trypsin-like peptidase domain-containing protein n=1 Tax=Streptomyces sp. NPDC048518 TaxID=3155029 RepID=UPI0033DE61F2
MDEGKPTKANWWSGARPGAGALHSGSDDSQADSDGSQDGSDGAQSGAPRGALHAGSGDAQGGASRGALHAGSGDSQDGMTSQVTSPSPGAPGPAPASVQDQEAVGAGPVSSTPTQAVAQGADPAPASPAPEVDPSPATVQAPAPVDPRDVAPGGFIPGDGSPHGASADGVAAPIPAQGATGQVPASPQAQEARPAQGGPVDVQDAVPAAPTDRPRPLHDPDPYSTPPYGEPGPWAPAPPVQHPAATPAHGTSLPTPPQGTPTPGAPAPQAPPTYDAPHPSPAYGGTPPHGTPAPGTPGAPAPHAPAQTPPTYDAPHPSPAYGGTPAPGTPGVPLPHAPAQAPAAYDAPHPAPPYGGTPPQGTPAPGTPGAPVDPAHATPGTAPAPAAPTTPYNTTTPHPQTQPHPGPGAPRAYDPWNAPLQQVGSLPPEAAGTRRKRGRRVLVGGAVALALVSSFVGGAIGSYLERNGSDDIQLRQADTESAERPKGSVAGIASAALPGVVTLHVSGDSAQGTGTGFVLDAKGHILTNNHVVEPAGTGGHVSVTFSGGETAEAEVVGRDSGYDLAVVKVSNVHGLKPLPLGNSENVQVGDPVVAIGAPFDLENTVTSGIISAKERPITAGGEKGDGSDISYVDALQTDAPINPGNSGGPLVDSKARVIGINSAIRSADEGSAPTGGQAGSIGLGFAIPINQGKRVAEELINFGRATHPVIGVTLDTEFNGDGARIADKGKSGGPSVNKNGPGDRAGLRPGDVITEVDGHAVHSSDELIVKVRAHRPKDRLRLTVERGGDDREVTLVLGSAGGN